MAGFLARVAAGTCTIFGSAWLVALSFDRYLTNLLVESTVQILNDPVVEEEVQQFMKLLLTSLLTDPGVEAKTPVFLKQVMSQPSFEEAAKVLLANAVETVSYRQRAMGLMSLVSTRVLTSPSIQLRLTKLIRDITTIISKAKDLAQIIRLPPFRTTYFPTPVYSSDPYHLDFLSTILNFKRLMSKFSLQIALKSLQNETDRLISSPFIPKLEVLQMPQMDLASNLTRICAENQAVFREAEQKIEANRLLEMQQAMVKRIEVELIQETAAKQHLETEKLTQELENVRELEEIQLAEITRQIDVERRREVEPEKVEIVRQMAPTQREIMDMQEGDVAKLLEQIREIELQAPVTREKQGLQRTTVEQETHYLTY